MYSDRQALPPCRRAARSAQGSTPEIRSRSQNGGPAPNPAPTLRKHGPQTHNKVAAVQAKGPTPGI